MKDEESVDDIFKHSSKCKDSRFKKKNMEKINEIIYFVCRKLGNMKVECPQLKKRRSSMNKKKKSLMVTQDDLDNEKSSSSYNEQANIYLMADTNDKVEVKTFSKSNTCALSDDEKDMPYDVLFHNYHMISLQCKKFLLLKTLSYGN